MIGSLATLFDTSASDVRIERRFEFSNMPENWLAVLTLAILLVLCWWVVRTYRAEARAGSTLAARMFLAVLRCAVILLLAAIWLEPVLATHLHQHIESYTLVLIDDSASMKIKDFYLDASEKEKLSNFFKAVGDQDTPELPLSRAELVDVILKSRNGEFVEDLAHRNRVKIYSYADKSSEIATLPARRSKEDENDPTNTAGPLDLNLHYTGRSTNLGQTLRRAVDSQGGAPIAGVVIIGDGSINEGEKAETLSHYARSRNLAIYTIGVGDASPPVNVRCSELAGPPSAFVKDPFLVTVHLEAAGLDGETLTVELTEQAADGVASPTLVGRKQVVVGTAGALEAIVFEHRKLQAGRFVYRVHVAAQPNESITQDNTRQISLNVLDNRMKVLLVSSGPSWTYRFLSRLLQRDDTFDLSCWLQSADRTAVRDGNTIIDHLPETSEELFVYDALVLLDPDSRQLPRGWAALADQHVSRNGAGLIYAAARIQTPRFFRDPTTEPVVQLLPVTPDPEADLILNQIGYYQKLSSDIEFPKTVWNHRIFSMVGSPGSEIDTSKLWQRTGKVYWHYPVKHEKPAATVYMRHGHPRMRNSYGGHVLLATQFVGAGRSAFLGFDGTWRWRRYGEGIFNQFWVQLIRYIAEGRLMGGHTRGRIHTDRDRYNVEEPIVFSARLTDGHHQPLTKPTVLMTLTPEGATRSRSDIHLQSDPNRTGWYRGQFIPREKGKFVASIQLEGGQGKEDVVISHGISITESNLEILQGRMDRRQLVTLAEGSAGGAYYDIHQAHLLPGAIPDSHESRVTEGSPEALWDSAWMLATLIGLLALEWALRKKWQLL